MQHLLQPKRAESILQATEAVERCECDVREYEQRFGKTLDEDFKIGVTLALSPLQVQNHCHLNSHILKSYAQVRTMRFDCCRAQADTAAGDAVPMDLSILVKGGKGKTRKGDKKCTGKGKANAKATKHFPRYCLVCKAWRRAMKDRWWDEMLRARRTLHLWKLPSRQLRARRRNHRSLEYI